MVKKGKEEHDTEYSKIEWDINLEEGIPKTREVPYKASDITVDIQKLRAIETEKYNEIHSNTLIGKTWQEMASQNDIPHRIDHLLRRRIQKLCRGTVSQ